MKKLLSHIELRDVIGKHKNIPQKPLSRPTEKQLLSWLKATDKETGPTDSSMAGLVFMVAGKY
jgi:hypothetical protein